MSWGALTSPAAYKSPAFIALVAVLCVALALLVHHCVITACFRRARGGGGGAAERRRRRQGHHRHRHGGGDDARREEDDDGEVSISVEVSAATSRTHLVQAQAKASPEVVCRYRKEEPWKESTCPVCLADFDDGEVVRVLPECMHYYHAECIDTWLRGSTSCPMCRAETTPTPTHTPSPASMHHHVRHLDLSVSVSLEEILVRT